MTLSNLDRRKFLKVMAAGTCGAACHGILRPMGMNAYAYDAPGPIKFLVHVFLYGGVSGYGLCPQHNAGAQAKMGALYRTPQQAVPLHHPDLSMHLSFANLVTEVSLARLAVVLDTGAMDEAGNFSRSHDEATTAAHDLAMKYNMATSIGIGAALAQAHGDPFGPISLDGATHYFENGAIAARSIGSLGTGREGFWQDNWYLYTEANTKTVGPAPRTAQQQQVKSAIVGMDEYVQTLQNLANISIPVAMPNTGLGRDLGDIVRLQKGGVGTFFEVGQGGYDTHQNQAGSLTNNFDELSGALTAYVQNLKQTPGRVLPTLFDETVIIVSSEFGRTDFNGSGTDHGLGKPTIVIGGRVNGNTYGDPMSDQDWLGNPRDYIGPEYVQFNAGQPFKEAGLAMGLPNIWPNYYGNIYTPLGLIS